MTKILRLPKRVKIDSLVLPEIKLALQTEADRRGISICAIAREALTDWTIQKLQSEKAKTPAA
jgi:hypothetical protein